MLRLVTMRRALNIRTKMSSAAAWTVQRLCQFVSDELEDCSTASDLQQQSICLHNCCRSIWQHMSLSWQNAADDDLRQRPADSRRPGMLEPCRTVPSRPGWSSWNPTNAEPEASAAPVAPALYGHSVERRKPTAQLHSVHSVQTTAWLSDRPWCSKKWVTVVQVTWNKRLDQCFDGVRWHRPDERPELP